MVPGQVQVTKLCCGGDALQRQDCGIGNHGAWLVYDQLQLEQLWAMLPQPGSKLLCCLTCSKLYLQPGPGAEGQLVPQATDKRGYGEEVPLVQLLEGLSQNIVPQGNWEAVK